MERSTLYVATQPFRLRSGSPRLSAGFPLLDNAHARAHAHAHAHIHAQVIARSLLSLFFHRSIHLSIYLSIYLSIHPSMHGASDKDSLIKTDVPLTASHTPAACASMVGKSLRR